VKRVVATEGDVVEVSYLMSTEDPQTGCLGVQDCPRRGLCSDGLS
jgi:hypothetical protein